MDVLTGISQVMANVHDGATGEDGEPIKIGLKREEEVAITDRRMIDGFNVKFSGKNLHILYHSEVSLSEVRKNNFESDILARVEEVASFLKKEFRKLKKESLTLKKEGEPSVEVQSTSRHRAWVQAECVYNLGLNDLADLDNKKENLDKNIKNFLEKGRKENPHKSE